ncbi:MAG: DUF3368 domain-containing protein [Verrucomicrobiae bacterium]|nr:DUF3368 domain-containing protein [Verrucomicrobiae bacterium]MDW8310011.1 DUF3368 domain-containing protein [Verrucomicrobiales bacterium]
MMVVANTSPLTALLRIGRADLLAKLFGRVVIPPAVALELQRAHGALPEWVCVKPFRDTDAVNAFIASLDRGEAEAIALALEMRADCVLMDERKGRRLAKAQGLRVLGLVGVVLLAKRAGLIASAGPLLEALESEAGFYLTSSLKRSALRSVGE